MKAEIVFIKDYANKKKDDVLKCDSMLAARIVNLKAAKYKKDVKKKKKETSNKED